MSLRMIFRNIKHFVLERTATLVLLVLTMMIALLIILYAFGAIQNAFADQKEIDLRTQYLEVYSYGIEELPASELMARVRKIINRIPTEKLDTYDIKGKIRLDGESEDISFIYSVTQPVIDVEMNRSFSDRYSVGDTIRINNKSYEIKCFGDYACDIKLPEINDDYICYRSRIYLREPLDSEQLKTVTEMIESEFPSAEKHFPETPDLLTVQFNYATVSLSAILLVIACLNLCYAYSYVLGKRKSWIYASLLCGARRARILNVFLSEILLYLLISSASSVLLFKTFVQPIVTSLYPDLENIYSPKMYIIAAGVFVAAVMLAASYSLKKPLNRTIRTLAAEVTA